MISTIAVLAVLAIVNLLTNRWAKRHYLVICLVATVVLIAIARFDGISWMSMGLARTTWRQGILWSLVVVAAVLVFYAIAAALPWTRKGFADKRAAEGGWWMMLYHSLIRIPFGTALLEETAFRAVLLSVSADVWGWWAGVAVSSLAFGLWHVLPSLDFHEHHDAAALMGNGRWAKVRSVVLTVLGTAAAGVGFCMLRGISGSLFPALALHAALNSIGFVVSWGMARRLREL
ncbi:MAG: CPBP family glutamic-type intramembrane protease [Candidatus Nanopelagicales bacterium]|nr:CPBP family glutamic-type intramembrane protease [Candidatus Nanopelagicales bacterium]